MCPTQPYIYGGRRLGLNDKRQSQVDFPTIDALPQEKKKKNHKKRKMS
jgi:hypothetical protein